MTGEGSVARGLDGYFVFVVTQHDAQCLTIYANYQFWHGNRVHL